MSASMVCAYSLAASGLAPAGLVVWGTLGNRTAGYVGTVLAMGLYGFTLVLSLWLRQWFVAAVAGGMLLAILALLWRSNRRQRRALRAYGAKSRARVAALVRRAREAARPRRVAHPVPDGVG